MIMRRRVILVLVTSAMLSGCETTAVLPGSAQEVPPARVVGFPLIPPGHASGTIVVTRDSGLFGSGLPILLSINKTEVAYFRTSETLAIPLPAGEHMVSIVPSPSLGNSPREYEVNLKPGATTHYRISMTQGGIVFQRTAETH